MNKKRRIIRKLLRPQLVCIYLLVIVVGILLLVYFVGGLKASKLDTTSDNIKFSEEGFTDMSTVEFDSTYEAKKIAQNDKYVLYLNEQNTIATVYTINEASKTGTYGSDGLEIIDITKCTQSYSTAKDDQASTSSNLVIQYCDAKTGKVINTTMDSFSNSVKYYNKLTEGYESHYYIKEVEDGVQILYYIGNFSAGENYLAEKYIATLYYPDRNAYIRAGQVDEDTYQVALNNWYTYMRNLGCENPEELDLGNSITGETGSEEDYKTYMNYLSKTFIERFRGNCRVITNSKGSGLHKELYTTGTIYVYTYQGARYIQNLIDSGAINGSYDIDSDGNVAAKKESEPTNTYWIFNDLDEDFIMDNGKYFNCPESPLTRNPYMMGPAWDFLQKSVYTCITQLTADDLYMYYKRNSVKGVTLKCAYETLYLHGQYTDTIGTKYTWLNSGEDYIVGGEMVKDEDGNVVWENGEIKYELYSLDKAAIDNAVFGIESATSLPVFSVCLQYKLDDTGLVASVLADSLVDSSNAEKATLKADESGNKIGQLNKRYELAEVRFLPYFCYLDNGPNQKNNVPNDTGMIVVPDGSGAIINFNNGKSDMNATAVNTAYYGSDYGYVSQSVSESTYNLMLGMFGFINNTPSKESGVLSIIEKGANNVKLYAYTNNQIAQSYFIATLRATENVKVGAYSKTTFYKWSKALNPNDLQFRYEFLDSDEADYVSLAQKYRTYLINKSNGKLGENDTTTQTVANLNFLGTFEKYALFLGFKYKAPESLTTFDQAKEIVEELKNGVNVDGTVKKVSAFDVSYTGWTNEELAYEVGGAMNVNSKIGGASKMRDFASYLNDNSINFYPEVQITSAAGYDLAFGNLKYSARSVANETAIRYQFDVATQRQNKKVDATYYLNAKYYESVTDTVLKSIDKLNINKKAQNAKQGLYLVDLGNLIACNYKKGDEIYSQSSVEYQKAALEKLSQNYNLKIKAPYDYAFEYVSMATDVPLSATQYQIYDEIIPLYQLVVSGLFDYTTEEINGGSNRSANWYYAKALETGSNLNFVLSSENPTILLDTDYTYYFQSYYRNWKEIIARFASDIDASGIHQGRLVYHKSIGTNVSEVHYLLKDGTTLELYVNTTSSDFTYGGYVVPAYNYVVK